MKKIGFLVAMDEEYRALRDAGLSAPDKVVVYAKTGMGKVNAARAATEMILSEHPDAIIGTGVAGGMVPDMHTGDLVIASSVAYHDVWCGEGNVPGQVQGLPQRFEADSRLLEAAAFAAGSFKGDVFTGLVASGDQFFISLEEDDRIRSIYPEVLAADMEAAAIAQVCHLYGVPFLNIRIISDIHTSSEIQKASYEDFWQGFGGDNMKFLERMVEKL